MGWQDLIDEAEQKTKTLAVNGQWANLQLKLSPASRETLNIGVVFKEDSGTLHTRFLENFEKFRCIYGKSYDLEALSYLASNIEEQLKKQSTQSLTNIDMPSPSVSLSPIGVFSGDSAARIVDNLLEETCILSKHKPEKNLREFKPRTNADVKKDLFEAIRIKSSLAAERIITQGGMYIEDGNTSRFLDVALNTGTQIGAVASAWYKTWQTIETNILKAEMNLNVASSNGKLPRALFLQRPYQAEGLGPDDLSAIDNGIDHYSWMLKREGVRLVIDESIERLADEVIDWADI